MLCKNAFASMYNNYVNLCAPFGWEKLRFETLFLYRSSQFSNRCIY